MISEDKMQKPESKRIRNPTGILEREALSVKKELYERQRNTVKI